MKKLFAILLALVMILSVGTTVFAADTYEDADEATVTVVFKDENDGVSPEETFAFTEFTEVSITENANASWPSTKPTITSAAYAEGDATAAGKKVEVTISLPEYTAVGIYKYSFAQVVPDTKTAGVTYYDTTMYLVVTVIEQNGKVRVAAVHCEGEDGEGQVGPNNEDKTDEFTNTYESGTLAVSKTVTGNMGDKTQYFDVTVTFTPASGETIKSTIQYSGGKYTSAQTVSNNTATIQLKDGDTVTFTNVPEGVTWKVEEADYTGEGDANGYEEADYSEQEGTIDAGDADTCEITNKKEVPVDTGIALDSLPYIVISVAVVAAAFVMIARKRRVED